MPIAEISLVLATVLGSLVAGFLFAFAVVVMPGIGKLPDREFLRAFREVDGVIQRGQPLFGLVWLGAALTLALGIVLGTGGTEGLERLLLLLAGGAHFLGVQLPTVAVNIPLNNELQRLELEEMAEAERHAFRDRFERRWNRWNVIRTAFAVLGAGALAMVLLGL